MWYVENCCEEGSSVNTHYRYLLKRYILFQMFKFDDVVLIQYESVGVQWTGEVWV